MSSHEPPGPPKMPRWVKISIVVTLILVLAGVVAMATGLGGEHGPGRHGAMGGEHMGGGTGTTDASIGAPADAATADRRIAISLLDTRYEPAAITVAPGETITFVLTNDGAAPHEFVLGTTAMQEQHKMAMEHGMAHDGESWAMLDPGEAKELTWKFGDTPLEYACHEPGHYDAGMRGTVRIAA